MLFLYITQMHGKKFYVFKYSPKGCNQNCNLYICIYINAEITPAFTNLRTKWSEL